MLAAESKQSLRGVMLQSSPRASTVGVDTFTFHRFLGEVRFDESRPEQWDFEGLLDVLDGLPLDVVSFETSFCAELDLSRALERIADRLAARQRQLVIAWGHPRGLEHGRASGEWLRLEDTCHLAREHGSTLVRFVLGGPLDLAAGTADDKTIDALVPRLVDLVGTWRNQRVQLALENHVSMPIEQFVALVERVEDLRVVLDLGNVVRVGGDLVETTGHLAERVAMVHAKDFALAHSDVGNPAGPWSCVPLGQGDLPVEESLGVLRRAGFDGPVCVELQELSPEWSGQEKEVLSRSLDWLRETVTSEKPVPGEMSRGSRTSSRE